MVILPNDTIHILLGTEGFEYIVFLSTVSTKLSANLGELLSWYGLIIASARICSGSRATSILVSSYTSLCVCRSCVFEGLQDVKFIVHRSRRCYNSLPSSLPSRIAIRTKSFEEGTNPFTHACKAMRACAQPRHRGIHRNGN